MPGCTGAPSFDDTLGCPVPPDKRVVAFSFIAISSTLMYGGLLLFWLRRHEPFVAKRSAASTFMLVLVCAVSQIAAYYGQDMPCWAFFLCNYILGSLLPGLTYARFFTLYARHLRQAEAVRIPLALGLPDGPTRPTVTVAALSVDIPSGADRLPSISPTHQASLAVDSPAREEATDSPEAAAVAPPVRSVICISLVALLAAYSRWLGKLLLRLRVDSPRGGIVVVLLTCVPWIIFAVARFSSSSLLRSSDLGCQIGMAEVAMLLFTFCTAPIALPAYQYLFQVSNDFPPKQRITPMLLVHVPCMQVPDSFLLRFEALSQLVIWPPLFVWFMADAVAPAGAHAALRGSYGVLIGCMLTLVISIWIPVLRSYSSRSRGRVVLPVDDRSDTMQRDVQLSNPAELALASVSAEQPPQQQHRPLPTEPTLSRVPSIFQLSRHTRRTARTQSSMHMRNTPESPHARPARMSSANASLDESPAAVLAALTLAASRFIYPAPPVDEIMATLRMPAVDMRGSSRTLSIVTSLLFATESGRALLYETLRLDLSAEFLGFLVDCEDVRCSAEEWMTHLALGGRDSGGDDAARGHEDAAEISGTRIASVDRGELTGTRVASVDRVETRPRTGTATAEAVPSPAAAAPREADAYFSDLSSSLTSLVARYVEFSAPHYISIGARDSGILLKAARLVASSSPVGGAVMGGSVEAAIEGALTSLSNAELDVFEMIVDPVRCRVAARPEIFDAWAAKTLAQAVVVAAADRTAPAPPSPAIRRPIPGSTTPSLTMPAALSVIPAPTISGRASV